MKMILDRAAWNLSRDKWKDWARLALEQLKAAEAERDKYKSFVATIGCLEPDDSGNPACDPPCLSCEALKENDK